MIIERAHAKKPIQSLKVKGIKELDFYKAIPYQVLVTPTEEAKSEIPYQPLNGFSLCMQGVENQNHEKIGDYGLFHDMENLKIVNSKGHHFNWLDIFKRYKNFKSIEMIGCDLPKE